MTKASFTMPDGTKVNLDGTPESIAETLKRLSESDPGSKKKTTKTPKKSRAKKGPQFRIKKLIDADFFKQPRVIKDVKDELAKMGHIYVSSNLSPPLIRLARGGKLRRQKNEDKEWAYVNP